MFEARISTPDANLADISDYRLSYARAPIGRTRRRIYEALQRARPENGGTPLLL